MKRTFYGITTALILLCMGCRNTVETGACGNMPECRLLTAGAPGSATWVWQELPEPVRAGKTYLISICAAFGSGSLLYDKRIVKSLPLHVLACNTMPDSAQYQRFAAPGTTVAVGQARSCTMQGFAWLLPLPAPMVGDSQKPVITGTLAQGFVPLMGEGYVI